MRYKFDWQTPLWVLLALGAFCIMGLSGCGKLLPEGASFAKMSKDAVNVALKNCGMDISKEAVVVDGNLTVKEPLVKVDLHKHIPPKCDWYIETTSTSGIVMRKYGNFLRPWWLYVVAGSAGTSAGGGILWLVIWTVVKIIRRKKGVRVT